jgi:predicted Zn-dependent protease
MHVSVPLLLTAPENRMALSLQSKTRTLRHSFRLRSLLALGTLAMAGCAVSTQQEVQMGQQYSAEIAKQLPLVQDPEVVRYINVLGDSLAKVTDDRSLQWHFAVVDSKEVNAFAVPGGYVYVNRGLIERAQSMSQVAGVIGHEIGHVTKRHSIKQMQKQQGAGIGVNLACILTRVCDSGLAQSAIQIGASGVFAQFSQQDESEADAEGVKTVIRARIDPNGIPGMFRILLDERKSSPGALDAFFATHPMEETRIAATQKLIAAYPTSQLQGLSKDSPNFAAFKRRLLSLPAPPAPKK